MNRLLAGFILLAKFSGCSCSVDKPEAPKAAATSTWACEAGPRHDLTPPPLPPTFTSTPLVPIAPGEPLPDEEPTRTTASKPLLIRPAPQPNAPSRQRTVVPVSAVDVDPPPGRPEGALAEGKKPAGPPGNPDPATAAVSPRVPGPLPTPLLQPAADAAPGGGGAPLVRLVNTTRVVLNFEVKDAGPSGISGLELWCTHDTRTWKKYEAPVSAGAQVVEVDREGVYGFTIVARNGHGVGTDTPAPGEQPQVWVVVDLTRPDVRLTEVAPSPGSQPRQVTIRWQASDKYLGPRPVTLYHAAGPDGPWKVIAANLENTGTYVWQAPPVGPSCFVRAEVTDLAGNVGQSLPCKPALVDNSVPEILITNVQASTAH